MHFDILCKVHKVVNIVGKVHVTIQLFKVLNKQHKCVICTVSVILKQCLVRQYEHSNKQKQEVLSLSEVFKEHRTSIKQELAELRGFPSAYFIQRSWPSCKFHWHTFSDLQELFRENIHL